MGDLRIGFANQFFQPLNIFRADIAPFGQVQHQRHRIAAEKSLDKIADGSSNNVVFWDGGEIKVGLTVGLMIEVTFLFQTTQQGLDGGISYSSMVGKIPIRVCSLVNRKTSSTSGWGLTMRT